MEQLILLNTKIAFSVEFEEFCFLFVCFFEGGWIGVWSRRSTGNWLQHKKAHPAGFYLPDDHPHAVQQQGEVHI